MQLPLPTVDVRPPDCVSEKSFPLPAKSFDCFAGTFHVPEPVHGVETLNETVTVEPTGTLRFRSRSSPELFVPNVPLPETNVGSGPFEASRLIGKTGLPLESSGPSTFADPTDWVLVFAFVIVSVTEASEPPGSADVSQVAGVADCARQAVYCLIPDEGGLADPAGVRAIATTARAGMRTASRRRNRRPSPANRRAGWFIQLLQ
ncbi:MAG: hypothetical protein E6G13_12795 [Actinobacteria bacterium]|nr:MAG: hypothetical protein E6G13_12795 [Actinomycetota bacterium]